VPCPILKPVYSLFLIAALAFLGIGGRAEAGCILAESLPPLETAISSVDPLALSDSLIDVGPAFAAAETLDSSDSPEGITLLYGLHHLFAPVGPLSGQHLEPRGGIGAGFAAGPDGPNSGVLTRPEFLRPKPMGFLVIQNVALSSSPFIFDLLRPPRSAS
jgi:hypothetical protein